MNKSKKLYKLRTEIMCENEKAIVLLEQIVNNDNIVSKLQILSILALERVKKISHMNEKIGKILKH